MRLEDIMSLPFGKKLLSSKLFTAGAGPDNAGHSLYKSEGAGGSGGSSVAN